MHTEGARAGNRTGRGAGWAVVCLCLCLGLSPPSPAANPVADIALIERLAVVMAEGAETFDKFDAQVWLMAADSELSRFVRQEDERLAILQSVYREAHRNSLDPDLVLAVMQVESAFDRFAVSRVGAQGLMQVMPFWRQEIGRPQDNLTHVETNIRYGTAILAYYIEDSAGDLIDALARYNGSRGRLKYPEKVVQAYRKIWQTNLVTELPRLQQGCARYGLRACGY